MTKLAETAGSRPMNNLRAIREARNLSQDQLGKLMNTSGASVSRYEVQDQRLTLPLMRKLAKTLRSTIAEIANEEPLHLGNTPDLPDMGGVLSYVRVPFNDVGAGMGGPRGAEDAAEQEILLPEAIVKGELRALPDHLRAFPVYGQSMEPLLRSGSVVVADARKTAIGGGGLFAIDDGDGLVVKWVQKVRGSDPPMLRFSSENPRFEPYERLADEAAILGLVVWAMGKIG